MSALLQDIQPGIIPAAELSNDQYHALTEWFSSTQLKAALPEHYKTGGSQEALDFGTLVHSVVLEPDNLGHYVPADADKIGVKSDGTPASAPTMTVAWKRFCAEAEQDGKTVVAQADWAKAHAMRDAIAAHRDASTLLLGDGESEVSAFGIDENGIRHKARFDRIIPGVIVDLKTTSSKPGADALTRTVLDYGYDVSASHYLAVADLLGLDVQGFGFVFVSKDERPRVTVCDLDAAFLDRGRRLRALAIERLTNPAADPYEGARGFLTLTAPEWSLRKVPA